MTNNMFKISSFENELYNSMKDHLIANQVEETHGFNKLAKATDYLYTAAELFDEAGMKEEADSVSELLKELSIKFA